MAKRKRPRKRKHKPKVKGPAQQGKTIRLRPAMRIQIGRKSRRSSFHSRPSPARKYSHQPRGYAPTEFVSEADVLLLRLALSEAAASDDACPFRSLERRLEVALEGPKCILSERDLDVLKEALADTELDVRERIFTAAAEGVRLIVDRTQMAVAV